MAIRTVLGESSLVSFFVTPSTILMRGTTNPSHWCTSSVWLSVCQLSLPSSLQTLLKVEFSFAISFAAISSRGASQRLQTGAWPGFKRVHFGHAHSGIKAGRVAGRVAGATGTSGAGGSAAAVKARLLIFAFVALRREQDRIHHRAWLVGHGRLRLTRRYLLENREWPPALLPGISLRGLGPRLAGACAP